MQSPPNFRVGFLQNVGRHRFGNNSGTRITGVGAFDAPGATSLVSKSTLGRMVSLGFVVNAHNQRFAIRHAAFKSPALLLGRRIPPVENRIVHLRTMLLRSCNVFPISPFSPIDARDACALSIHLRFHCT